MTHVTLKHIRAFLAVAQSQSFAEAAAMIHLSQPALSNAIKSLEQQVGGTLFARTTRTFALTPEGESFYPMAERLIRDWDDAIDDLQNRFALRQGRLSIAAIPSFAGNLLPTAISHYRRLYPNIRIALHDVIAEEVVAMVRSGRAEIGISFEPGKQEDLQFTPLFNDQFMAVLPAHHHLVQHTKISARELLTYDVIALQPPSQVRELLHRKLKEHDLTLSPTYESHQLMTIGRMVSNGLGVSIVPSLCQRQMKELGVICRPLVDPIIEEQVGILRRTRYPLSASAEAMATIMHQTFGNKSHEA